MIRKEEIRKLQLISTPSNCNLVLENSLYLGLHNLLVLCSKMNNSSANTSNTGVGKSGKRICCSCPDTKQKRDECVVTNGESKCAAEIEAHKQCLRADGFTVN